MDLLITVNFVLSAVWLLGGLLLKNAAQTPKDSSVGFKTERATESQAAWGFANRTCGRIWTAFGAVGIVLTAAGMLLLPEKRPGVWVQAGILLLLSAAFVFGIAYTESRLKRGASDAEKGRTK